MTIRIPDLVTVRARHPEAVSEAAARRTRRPLIGDHGRLVIVAADHPARGALRVGDRPLAMADRADVLERLCTALDRPGVGGVLATAGILEDLLLLGILENKVVMGSVNRGGLAGASFEMDDRFTGHRPADLERLRFDAGRLLPRLDHDDPGSLRTLYSTARAVDDMAARRLPLFVEQFISRRVDGKVRNDLSPEAVTRSVAIAAGLGGTSAHTWLKLPITDDPDAMAEVLETSTLPTVLLDGEVGQDQEGAYEKWRRACARPPSRAGRRPLTAPPRRGQRGDHGGHRGRAALRLRNTRSPTATRARPRASPTATRARPRASPATHIPAYTFPPHASPRQPHQAPTTTPSPL